MNAMWFMNLVRIRIDQSRIVPAEFGNALMLMQRRALPDAYDHMHVHLLRSVNPRIIILAQSIFEPFFAPSFRRVRFLNADR